MGIVLAVRFLNINNWTNLKGFTRI